MARFRFETLNLSVSGDASMDMIEVNEQKRKMRKRDRNRERDCARFIHSEDDWKWNSERPKHFTQSTKRCDKSNIHNEQQRKCTRTLHTFEFGLFDRHAQFSSQIKCTHLVRRYKKIYIINHRKIHYIRSRTHHIQRVCVCTGNALQK